jgi:beta-RFAP synthase
MTLESNHPVFVRTPSRLHFGLLALGEEHERQFGGAGLMIRRPEVLVRIAPSDSWRATGRLADRAMEFAQRFAIGAAERGWAGSFKAASLEVLRVPRPHTGLGSGTQLAMAVATGLTRLMGCRDLSGADLAALVKRGKRSAIGAHGFFHGGFIVEGGKPPQSDPSAAPSLSPMVMRITFPESWRVVLVRPHALEGLAGQREAQAFASLPAIPRELTAEMCRLVLLGLAPALVDRNLQAFGESLFELQQLVGRCFAGAQGGGVYADPLLEKIVAHVRDYGISGVGQSSWGPALYAVTGDQSQAELLAAELQRRFSLGPGELLITEGDNHGATIEPATDTAATEPSSRENVRRTNTPPRA